MIAFCKRAHFVKQTALAAAIGIALVACQSGNDSNSSSDPGSLEAPNITMDLPVTLSGVVASSNQKAYGSVHMAVADPNSCMDYFDPQTNFMENGYQMTRFLVGLSQSQSCFADFLMAAVASQGVAWINQGMQMLPANPNDPGAPSHVQVEQSGGTTQVWLYFATHDVPLPADLSTVQTIYLTWSGSGDNVNGQYYMVNIPLNPNDPDAPEGVRVDFNRTASTASNKIYMDMRASHSGGLGGFRIDVDQTGIGTAATYTAKGLISFLTQPFPGLPSGLALPEFAAAAVVDANGLGAASANFNNFAISLIVDGGDGVIDPNNNEFDLGSYQFTISDTTYFDPALYNAADTATPFVSQITEWRNKGSANAVYVADHPRIDTIMPVGLESYSVLHCLEANFCDYNQNGVMDNGEWQGFSLGVGYFATTCVDDAAAVGNDCNALMNKMFENSLFGISYTPNSTVAEPSGDWRNVALGSLTQLSSVHPEADPTGVTTFDVPAAPVR